MQALLIFLVFTAAVLLMYARKLSALVGLPLVALAIAACAQIPIIDVLNVVITGGASRLHVPMITILFGAILAEVVNRSGIVEVLIKNAAEFAGDRPVVISLVLFFVVAMLFMVLSGLGAVVMVGSIVFPILISIGVSHTTAAVIFLFGFSLGGMFNLMNWSLYIDVLKLTQADVMRYLVYFIPGVVAVSALSLVFFLRKDEGSSFKRPEKTVVEGPSFWNYLTPVLPVVLVFAFGLRALLMEPEQRATAFQFPLIAAMVIGVIYGVIVAPRKLGSKTKLLAKSSFDGIANVAPAVVLMFGIGMLLMSVSHPAVKEILSPYVKGVLPTGALNYILFFTVLAPLALYRGPLNIWGMGSGLIAMMKESGAIPAPAIMAALLAVGQIQGVSDPTNTHNVWISNYLNVDVVKILKVTLVPMWIVALIGLAVGAALYY